MQGVRVRVTLGAGKIMERWLTTGEAGVLELSQRDFWTDEPRIVATIEVMQFGDVDVTYKNKEKNNGKKESR